MTTITIEQVTAFLMGEAPLDGVWFGERHPTERGAFWWRKHLRAALAAPATAPEQQSCKWAFDDDESNTWASGCGELWSFIDGGPAENRVKYCHGCGKPVVLGDKQ